MTYLALRVESKEKDNRYYFGDDKSAQFFWWGAFQLKLSFHYVDFSNFNILWALFDPERTFSIEAYTDRL